MNAHYYVDADGAHRITEHAAERMPHRRLEVDESGDVTIYAVTERGLAVGTVAQISAGELELIATVAREARLH